MYVLTNLQFYGTVPIKISMWIYARLQCIILSLSCDGKIEICNRFAIEICQGDLLC